MSDVFVDLWNRMDVIDLDKGIVAYLYKAVSTRALNVLRHKNIAAVRIETLDHLRAAVLRQRLRLSVRVMRL